MSKPIHVRQTEPFRWEGVPLLAYKEDQGTHFKAITRQVLFEDGQDLGVELRYFEIAPGGHSTLERHGHVHAVMVIRGSGQVLVGEKIRELVERDLVFVAPLTWHQFRATGAVPLGFLCVVRCGRDRPQRPSEADLEALRSRPEIAAFIRA